MAAADYRIMTEATGQRIAAALEALVNLGDPVTIAHGGTGQATAAAALAALGGVAVTDIVNNLTSTATDKPLSAAQGAYKYLKTYTSVTQLGLTDGSATIASAMNALPLNSILMAASNDFSSSELPGTGTVVMGTIRNTSRRFISFYGKTADLGDYRMFIDDNTSEPTGTWIKAPTVDTAFTGNADDLRGIGFYYCNGATSTGQTTMYGGLLVIGNGGNRGMQIFGNVPGGLLLYRVYSSSGWGAWKSVTLT